MNPVVEIVPFGKYKGKPLEILQSDPKYCEWLTAQDWFRENHASVYQLIINNFCEPTETPEHNRLQAMFLNNTLCLQLLRALSWEPLSKNTMIDKVQKKLNEARTQLAAALDHYYNRKKDLNDNILEIESFLEHYHNMENSQIKIENEFEYSGWDVKIVAKLPFADAMWRSDGLRNIAYQASCSVEIKPDLGDNYPAILRQVKASEQLYKADYRVLVFDKFTAAGATLEQVRQIFRASGFHVLSFSEICSVRLA